MATLASLSKVIPESSKESARKITLANASASSVSVAKKLTPAKYSSAKQALRKSLVRVHT